MRIALVLAAPAFALVAAPAVAAGPNATEFESQVEHDDLDLTSKKGVTVLDSRVKTIIRRNCANGGRDSASRQLERQCRESAFAAAQPEVRTAIAKAEANKVRFASTKPVAPEA